MRAAVRVLVPHFLEPSDSFRQSLEVLVAVFLVQRHSLLAQPLQGQEMFDAAVGAPLLVVREMVLQQDALLADLPEVETTIEDGQEVGVLCGWWCMGKLRHRRPPHGHGGIREGRLRDAVVRKRPVGLTVMDDQLLVVHRETGSRDREGRAGILGIVSARLVRNSII